MNPLISLRVRRVCSQAIAFASLATISWFGASLSPIVAQEKKANIAIPGVEEALRQSVDNHEVAGALTLVVDDQGPLSSASYGLADIKTGDRIQDDSIFWIASMSKPITAACVMILVDDKKLALEDDITRYLPEMKQLRTQSGEPVSITIEHLLNHTSGMSELPSESTYTSITLEEAAVRYAKLPVMFPPGSKWSYSQTGINTAARIVEVVSGKTFDVFLAERLCKPLGMVDTTFYLSADQWKRLAKSYSRTETGTLKESEIWLLAGKQPTDRNRFPAANGGLFSTASDYGRFCRMLLNDGSFDGKQILSRESVKRLKTPTTNDLKVGFTDGNAWGVGCCVVRNPQGATKDLSVGSFGHGGAYGTQAWIDPVKKRAYILMVQRANFPNADDSDVKKAFIAAASKTAGR